ncbi:MAG: DUF1697 domain-containing protein [Bacteroidota bacterium]|nr:DUF1697 domain-containing protein [Bacteroidota bacterium]
MQTFVSILRGINVSGQKKMLMSDLKVLYEGLKFKDVITYIQSGNVIFKSEVKISDIELAKKIELSILKKYGFNVPVIIRSVQELTKAISINPFLKEKNINLEKLHITFLSEIPKKENVENINALNFSPDQFIIIGKEVFLYCPGGYGETKLSNNFFEKKLKVNATTRNWKTVNKLLELAKN